MGYECFSSASYGTRAVAAQERNLGVCTVRSFASLNVDFTFPKHGHTGIRMVVAMATGQK